MPGSEHRLGELVLGARIAGKYKVKRILGQGGMGVVAAAVHEELDQEVAIKFLFSDMTDHQQSLGRFVREARLAARLKTPHAVKVYDVGTFDRGIPYMVMELLEGNDLSKELETRGPLPVAETIDYVLQALEALAEAHGLGIVHRDLKPGNIFLVQGSVGDRLVKILDFGISKVDHEQDAKLTTTRALLGSPTYMSPEQVRSSREVDERSDIWSLGIILYELLTKQLPFEGESIGELFGLIQHCDPRPIRSARADVPEELAKVIHRCILRDREQRFQNVVELAEAITPFGTGARANVMDRAKQLYSSSKLQAAKVAGVDLDSTPKLVHIVPLAPAHGGTMATVPPVVRNSLLGIKFPSIRMPSLIDPFIPTLKPPPVPADTPPLDPSTADSLEEPAKDPQEQLADQEKLGTTRGDWVSNAPAKRSPPKAKMWIFAGAGLAAACAMAALATLRKSDSANLASNPASQTMTISAPAVAPQAPRAEEPIFREDAPLASIRLPASGGPAVKPVLRPKGEALSAKPAIAKPNVAAPPARKGSRLERDRGF